MADLRVDFFESGIGDTIVVTFPGGGIGVIDAHPSASATRPAIESIIDGKEIHFVCLTHPHEDHADDLVPILKKGGVKEFWCTVSDIASFVYRLGSFTNFPSPVQEVVQSINAKKAKVFIELFDAVSPAITVHPYDSFRPKVIDDVQVHFLAPDQQVLEEFRQRYYQKVEDPTVEEPDFNLLSLVIALEFAGTTVLLGADALKRNWTGAVANFRQRGLPKARILKVPHHGAANSIDLQKSRTTYLDACSRQPRAEAVIFAGNKKHPNAKVFKRLRAETEVTCLGNGLKLSNSNPLQIRMPGAFATQGTGTFVCNPVISFAITPQGDVQRLQGTCSCVQCGL